VAINKEKILKDNKLILVVLVSLVIVGVVIFTNIVSFSKIESVIISQLKDNQMTKTESAALQIENHVLQVKNELATLSKFPAMNSLNVNVCSGDMKIIHQNIEGKINSLLRVDKYGQIIESSEEQYRDYLGLNIREKDYFKIPIGNNEPFIAGIIQQGENQHIIISTPLFKTSSYTPYPNHQEEFEGVLLSIIELSYLYNLYLHPILNEEQNYFILVNLDTNETLRKSEEIGNFSELPSYLQETKDGLNLIADVNGFGQTIITSSNIILGKERWALVLLTPLTNIGQEIVSVQKRHLFSLIFVILVVIATSFFTFSLYRSKEQVQSKLDKAKVTLDKLGINIELEEEKYNQSDIHLDPKQIYLIKEDDDNQAYELFIGSLNRGFAGLGIVRENPQEVKRKYNLEKTSFIWLSKNKVGDQPCETNIDNLTGLVQEFISKSKKSVILIDRLDYIISENEFSEVIKKIHEIKDLISSNEAIVIFSLNPGLVEEAQFKAIEAETIDLYGKHLRKRVELTTLELDLLKLINEGNISNKLISYKDITSKFKITKPTTRVKINKLHGLGLIQIEPRGRFKSLKITSAGRKIID